jgi:hypothetical protein
MNTLPGWVPAPHHGAARPSALPASILGTSTNTSRRNPCTTSSRRRSRWSGDEHTGDVLLW